MNKFIGIDISKQTFDVSFKKGSRFEHLVFKNNQEGFSKFLNLIDKEDWVVMEASGIYHTSLAFFLVAKKVKVSVVNPLVIKRYCQSRMIRAKTDKKDAQMIAEYASTYREELSRWKADSPIAFEIKQLHTAIELLNKQIRQSSNQLQAFQSAASLNKSLERSLQSIIKTLKKQKEQLEKQIESLAFKAYRRSIEVLMSISGIGKKTAIMLTVTTGNFTKFNHYKELIAYVGFSPRIYQSGTSVQGKGHICKMGKSQIRKLLYMCSLSAMKTNKSCVEMYIRLKEKGKATRVVLIAIANKLLKQAFAIGVSKVEYRHSFISDSCGKA